MALRAARSWTCGLLAIALFVGGCAGQSSVRQVEKPQPPVVEEHGAAAVLARNAAGMLYLLYPEGMEQSAAVVIEHDSRRYVFVSSWVDEKTSHLLPLVPVSDDWIAEAVEGRANFWHVDVFEPEAFSRQAPLSGTFGFWGGAGEAIDWLGDVPAERQVGLVVPVSAVFADGRGELRSLTDTASGIVEFEGGRVVRTEFDAFLVDNGPYLVIPDGYVHLPGRALRMECLNSVERCMGFIEAAQLADLRASSQLHIYEGDERSEKDWTALHYRAAFGRELGWNAFLSMNEERVSVASGEMILGRRELGGSLPLSIGEQALELGQSAEEREIVQAVAALGAMLSGNLLTAAYLLRDVSFEVGQSARKAQLHRLELVGAAGFSSWARAEILHDRKTIDTQTAVALARSFAHGLDWVAAKKYVEIALEGVGKKNTGARAEILRLKAQVLAGLGEFKQAAAVAGDAAAGFKAAGRGLQAAAVRLEQAEYARDGGDARAGFEAGRLARDEFVEQGAVFWAGDTEIRLATWLIDDDRRSEAMDLLESAIARLSKTTQTGLLNRAHVVGLLARQQAQPGFDAVPGLLEMYDRAGRNLDWAGSAFAASLLINSGFLGEGEQRKQFVVSLMAGLESRANKDWEESMFGALAVACFHGLELSEYESELKMRFDAACQPLDTDLVLAPKILAVWIGQVYQHLQKGELERAGTVLEELREQAADVVDEEHFLRAVEIMLLEAVLLERQSGDSEQHVERAGQALELLENSLEADAFAEQVFQFSEQFRVRGIDWLAVLMQQKYVEQADSEQEKAARTLQYAQVLHEAGRWAELLELGIADVDSVEAHMLALYRSDAAYQLGARKLALELRDQAIKSDALLSSRDMFELLKLAIQVDVRRGDLKRAQAVGEAVELVDPSDADVQSEQARCALAGLLGARAEVMALLGEHDQAERLFNTSLAMFGELPVHASANVRIHVLEAWGRTAQRVEQLQEAIEQLVLFRTQLSHFFEPAAARDASVALIRLRLSGGIVSQAHRQFVELLDSGLSSGASPVANRCLRAKIGLFGYGYEGDSDGLSGDLRHCVTLSTRPDERAEAEWLVSLIDPSTTLKDRVAQTRAYQKALGSADSREAERLTYLIELGSHKQESARASVGLGIAKSIGALRPVDARRELMELLKDEQVMAQHSVEVMRLLMQVSLVFGHWQQAGLFAGEIETLATEPGDAQVRADVRALVKRFSLEKGFEN